MPKGSHAIVRGTAIAWVLLLVCTGFATPSAAVVSPTGRMPVAPTSFHSYASLVAELQDLQRSYPTMLRVRAFGESWETTRGIANRSLFVAELGLPGGTKREVLFMGLHHGDEWISMEVVVYLLRYFLLNAGNDGRVDAILAQVNISFVPVVNPDGLEYSQTQNHSWRKTRTDNGDGTFGVDLNRNYGYMWGSSAVGVETKSPEYRGPAPFSEPESQAIRALARSHPPVFSIAYHSAGQWILYPWSYTRASSPDDDLLRGYATNMADANGYRVLQEGRASNVRPGNSDDWLYASFRTAAFTYEVGLDFASQNASRIGGVVRNNVESALRGSEIALGLRKWWIDLGQLTLVGGIGIAAVGGLSSVYFVWRWRRIRRDALVHSKVQSESRTPRGH